MGFQKTSNAFYVAFVFGNKDTKEHFSEVSVNVRTSRIRIDSRFKAARRGVFETGFLPGGKIQIWDGLTD